MTTWLMVIHLWSAPGYAQHREVQDWGACVLESVQLMKNNPNVRAVECVPVNKA